jgi:hypothetical protein
MTIRFEPGKYYKTRDGRKARIYITDAGGTYPVHGAVWNTNIWILHTWQTDGIFNNQMILKSSLDLIAEWEEPTPKIDDMVTPIWFKTGKSYRTVSGERLECVAVNCRRAHTEVFIAEGGEVVLTTLGRCLSNKDRSIAGEWEEPQPRGIVYEWMFRIDGDWVMSGVLTDKPLAAVARKTGRAFYADDGSPVPQDVLDNQNTRR